MIGPLLARSTYSQLNPEILIDKESTRILEKVKEDFPDAKREWDSLDAFMDEFTALNFIIRARIFDDAISEFISTHQNATIVNIGCGLDTTLSRIDNGKIKWFNLDLPEGIEYRLKYIPEDLRNKCIGKSMFDYSWFNDVDFNIDNGILFFAAGLFNYYEEQKLSALCNEIAKNFPGGVLLFDNPTSFINKIINRRFRKLKVSGLDFQFGLNHPKRQILPWSDKIKEVSSVNFYKTIKRNKKWKLKTRFLMEICDKFNLVKFCNVYFK